METPDPTQASNSISERPRKKLWHGIVGGFGCAVPTLAGSFLLLIVIVVAATTSYLSANSPDLTDLSVEEILRGLGTMLIIAATGSLVIALTAGILVGRITYRRSADARAASRLFTSMLAGLGVAVALFVISYIAGIILETQLLFSNDPYFLNDSTFGLLIFIPILPGIFIAIVGGLASAAFVFQRQMKKEGARSEANL